MNLNEKEKAIITERNRPFIILTVCMYANRGIETDKLMDIAMRGFEKALNTYKGEEYTEFITYSSDLMEVEILSELNSLVQ